MAPDTGFVPGAERFPSVLAHYVQPADLVRELAHGARSDEERAFAWGWAAHVVGDVVLHPQVGHACGEAVRGDRSQRLNAMDDLETHVGMEVGLDILVLASDPDIPRPERRPFFSATSIEFLRGAYARAYGIDLDAHRMWLSHRRATQRTARWPNLLRVLDRAHGVSARGRSSAAAGGLVSVARRFARAGSAFRGLLRPRRPPAWLVELAQTEGDRFPARLATVIDAGLEQLENRNLESGELTGPHDPHPESRAAYEQLRALRGESRVSD